MKKILFYVSIIIIMMSGCKEPETKIYTINMQKVTGDWIVESYRLPTNIIFRIDTHRGSYSLNYYVNSGNWWNDMVVIEQLKME